MRGKSLSAILIVALWGCEAGSLERSASPSPESASEGVNEDGTSTAKGQKNGGKKSSSSKDDESNLAAYLMTSDEVANIQKLVDPYKAPSFAAEKIASSTTLANARTFVESFANKVMKLEKMKPGRSFKVHIIDDEFPNAFDDGWQNLGVHVGILKYSTPRDSLSTICHEMAHSAKNAAFQREAMMREQNIAQKMAELSTQIDQYVNKQYNRTSKEYVHNLASYQSLRKAWDEFDKKYGLISKRLESEADVVGAMICASAGLSVEDFMEGYRDFEALIDKITSGAKEALTANQLQNGEKVPLSLDEVSSFVSSFLFPSDSHPSNAERLQQLERLASLITPYYQQEQTLASLWLDNIKKLGGSGLNLTAVSDEFDAAPVIATTTSLGAPIFIVKGRCHH